uniref:Peptidase S1 domain-containing protein n=1 Tax=Heliothis virescens TaxID=7102 RepID=A0A2A4JC25_HELVI
MIKAISALLALALAIPTYAQHDFVSPCPNVFTYEPTGSEAGKWYGIVNLTTDTTLYALWLNIVLESKADILGNWVGEVTTEDNIDFKIENTKLKISPGPPLVVRFFIQYNTQKPPPKLKAIRFNGKEICDVDIPQSGIPISYNDQGLPTTSTTVRPKVTTSRNNNKQRTTTKAQYWQQTEKSQTTKTPYERQTTPSRFWTEATTLSTTPSTTRTQYWQQTTSKPAYWTQSKNEAQTTEKVQVWSYVKSDNSQTSTTTARSSQVWPQNNRAEIKQQPITEKNSQKVQTWTIQKAGNQQTKTQDRTVNHKENRTTSTTGNKQTKNDLNQYTTEKSSVWPKVPEVQQANTKVTRNDNKPQTEVKQPVQTHHWPKITTENITGAAEKSPSRSETASYVWPENQNTYNTHSRDTPIYVRPEDKPASDNRYERPQTWTGTGTQRVGENNGQKQGWSGDKTSSWNANDYKSGSGSSGYTTNDSEIKKLEQEDDLPFYPYQLTTEAPSPAVYKVSSSEEYDAPKKEDKIEYYVGGLPIFYIPNHGPRVAGEPECGKVLLNKERLRSLKPSATLEGQWPWQIALYQQQTSVDFKYICGGTLVSKRHVITAAHCVTKKGSARVVNKNTLTVYLGKHNLRTSVEGVQVKFVNRILVHPEYDPQNFKTDIAILELRDLATYSDWVQPVCLWPENEMDIKNIVGQKGSVVGWGYDVTGVARQELTLLEMPVVDRQTCVNSYREFFGRFTSEKSYCAGYRERGSACNGDSGGGMVFQKGESWYLRGVVSLSVAKQGEYQCDPHHYVIFTDVAKLLPWIEDIVEDYY